MATLDIHSLYSWKESRRFLIESMSKRGYAVVSEFENSFNLKGGRGYNGVVMAVLIIIGLLMFVVGVIIAIIYYFVCSHKQLYLSFQSDENGGCFINATSPSERALKDMKWTIVALKTPPVKPPT